MPSKFAAMTDEPHVHIFVNGEPRAVPSTIGLAALIESLGLPMQGTLIEHNGTALFRDEWPHVRLAEGDRLELLRIVAGG